MSLGSTLRSWFGPEASSGEGTRSPLREAVHELRAKAQISVGVSRQSSKIVEDLEQSAKRTYDLAQEVLDSLEKSRESGKCSD